MSSPPLHISACDRPEREVYISAMEEAVFESLEDATDYCTAHSRTWGAGLTVQHSDRVREKVTLGCDKGSYHGTVEKPVVDDDDRVRERATVQTLCSYKVLVRLMKRRSAYVASPVCTEHNHPPSLDASAHRIFRRFDKKEVEKITELPTGEAGLKRAQISRTVKQQIPDNISTPRDFSNAIAKAKKEERHGLTYTEAAIERLKTLGWVYEVKTDPADGSMTDFMFMPPEGMALLQRFPTTLFMDCAYRTNKAKLPLFEVVGMTNTTTDSTFAVAFGVLSNEKEAAYQWALRWMMNELDKWDARTGHNGQLPTRERIQVVLTDRELALVNAVEKEISSASGLLCIWHINKAVHRTTGVEQDCTAIHARTSVS